jgi:hypothetical protein
MANLKYTSVKNDYSLVFDVGSEISKVEDDESIQSTSFNFKGIEELVMLRGMRTIDFIGVAHFCGPVKDK